MKPTATQPKESSGGKNTLCGYVDMSGSIQFNTTTNTTK